MSLLKSESFERIVLASITNGYNENVDGLADMVISKLTENHFTSAGRQYLFNLTKSIRGAGLSINTDVLMSYICESDEILSTTAPNELAGLATIATQDNLDVIIKALVDYRKARLIEYIGLSIQQRLESNTDLSGEINNIHADIESVFIENSSTEGHMVCDLLTPFVEGLVEAKKHDGILGTTLGIKGLDATTGGIRKGETCVIAALPGMGKTSWATSIACKNILDDKGVAFFSVEMTKEELIGRMIPQYADMLGYDNLRYSQIRNPSFLGGESFGTISDIAKELKNKKLYIDDNSRITVQDIRSTCYKLRSMGALDLIIVDYLQLMVIDDNNAPHELTNISAELKRIGKEFMVPVIELSQLNVRDTHGQRPTLGNLKGSGSLEANADAVLFPWREYAITKEGDATYMVILIAKGRAFDGRDVESNFSTKTMLVGDRLKGYDKDFKEECKEGF